MLAKPIIDIQIAAESLEAIKSIAIDELKKLGYEYWYDNPDPERMFFVKGMPPFGEKRTHHIHIFEPSSRHWQGKIFFRDYLISHPDTAHEYQQLKIQLAQQHTYDREQYTDAKTKFINDILQNASLSTRHGGQTDKRDLKESLIFRPDPWQVQMIPKTITLNIPDIIDVSQHLSSKGNTKISNNNLFYLNIDDEYIHQLFPLLKDEQIKKPDYFGEKSAGAHITVAYPEERKTIKKEDLDQEHNFIIKNAVTAEIGHKKYYVLLVESSSLLQLRKKYKLPDLLCFKGYSIGFHITIGVKALGR